MVAVATPLVAGIGNICILSADHSNPFHNQSPTRYRSHKASKLRPKIDCHDNVPQHLYPHLTHDFLGASEPITQTASRSVQPFLHRWPQSVPILYNGTPPSSSKLPLPMGRSGLYLIHGSVGPPESSPKRHLIGSAIFVGLTTMTDRLRYWSVITGRIHVRSTGDAAAW